MSNNTDDKTSVKSPSNSIEGVNANCGGMPATWSPEKIWSENTPPATPAKDSTVNMGSSGK